MRQLPLPNDNKGSHEAILQLGRESLGKGLVPRVLVLVARESAAQPWRSVFGRIDLAKPGDPKPVEVRPKNNVRLIEERLAGATLLERLSAAMSGAPFRIDDIEVNDHAMDSVWQAWQLTSEWMNEGTEWPCVVASMFSEVKQRPYLREPIEAEGPIPVFKDLESLVRSVSGFRETSRGPGRDIRFSRYQILLWDYRGRVESFDVSGNKLRIKVSPPGDTALRLAGVVESATNQKTFAESGPSELEIDLGEPIVRANLSLRHGDDLLVQHEVDFPRDALIAAFERHAGHRIEPARTPEPTPAEVVVDLGFLADSALRAIITRDLDELAAALSSGSAKTALLLCGSILEGLLLDVLDRNRPVASSFLKRPSDWPDDVSLSQFIEIAGKVNAIAADGKAAPILDPRAARLAASVTEHRDLIHPRAEVRTGIKVDPQTVELMVALLKNVFRDLSQAHAEGLIDSYANGHIQ